MSERLLAIFFELYGRMPTVEEAEDFAEHIVLIEQFSSERELTTPVELRAEQVKEQFGVEAKPVDTDEIYAMFNGIIAGMQLDIMIQESVYYWKIGGNYYADNLEELEKID